jgi:DNA polymerase-3 subunit delta
MSALTRQALQGALKRGEIAPLYLLHGAEEYLRENASRAITETALRDAPLREFNETTYSLASTDVQQAIAAAEQLPMMSSRRVVRIKDFARLREADEDAVLRYIARPVESSVVIFVADELDKRRKLSKALMETCASIEFALLTDAELTKWTEDHLKRLKVNADDRTVHQIVALVGSSVRKLSTELEKLATAVLDTGFITMEMVDTLVGHSRELSNFELTDHLIARNRKRALQTLERLLDDGAEPVMLIGLLASNYHRLALAKELMSRGAANQEVYRQVGIYGKREEFLAVARRTDARKLAQSLERIAAADLAIKTSKGTPRLQLEILVCELSA